MQPLILVAEDESFLRELIHLDLQDKGAEIRLAADGSEAIGAIEEARPSILLLDLLMPKLDGYGVLEYIRSKGHDFPVIILSNLSDPLEKEKCFGLGATDFLVKSDLDEGELWERIKKYVAC